MRSRKTRSRRKCLAFPIGPTISPSWSGDAAVRSRSSNVDTVIRGVPFQNPYRPEPRGRFISLIRTIRMSTRKTSPLSRRRSRKLWKFQTHNRGAHLGPIKRLATRSRSPEPYFQVVAEGVAGFVCERYPNSAPLGPGRLEL